jgi:hypothetical protein
MSTKKYFPSLNDLISQSEMTAETPSALAFVKDAIDSIFSKLHYRDLVIDKSVKGDSAFYSLKLVSKDTIGLDIGTGENKVSLVINPNGDYSSLPITLEWYWEILGMIKTVAVDKGVLPAIDTILDVAQEVFNLSETAVLAHALNQLVKVEAGNTKYEQLVLDLKAEHPFTEGGPNFVPDITGINPLGAIAAEISETLANNGLDKSPAAAIFQTYLLSRDANGDTDEIASWDEIKSFNTLNVSFFTTLNVSFLGTLRIREHRTKSTLRPRILPVKELLPGI